MQINNGNTSTVKSLVTETADVQSLLHARVNGNGDVVEEPAVTFVAKRYTNGCAKPRHTHTGPQIVDDVRLAVLRAESAVYLIDTLHITVAEAAKRTNSNAAYIGAWRLLQQSGDVQLMEDVRAGCISLLAAAKLVKPLVEMKAAFEAAKAVNPVGIIDFFKTAEVKSFATAAEVVTAEEHLKAAVAELGIYGTFDYLAAMEESEQQRVARDYPNLNTAVDTLLDSTA
jgi:hypothetical protein